MKAKRCIVLTATSSSQGTKGERKVKKKLILIMTAILLVFSTAIVCVACKGAKTIKFDKKMGIGEIMSALVKTDIKNFTVVTTSKEDGGEGYVTKEYYTQSGYGIAYELNGERKSSSVRFFEGNRYYYLTKRSDQSIEKYVCSVGDNEVVKESIDTMQDYLSKLIVILYSIKECGGNSYYLFNSYEGASVYVEDKNGFVIETKSQKFVYKDFNKTKLNVDDFEDYKNYDATIPIGMYEESEDGTYYEFWDILKYIGPYEPILLQLKNYTIQSEFTKDGKTMPVKAIKFSGNGARKYIIPTSIEKVSFINASPYMEYCYLGTKADWESKVTVETYPYADIVVKCSDGEVTVKKQATANP